MSSVAVRDWTTFRLSVASSRPPAKVQIGLANSSWTITASSTTVAVPLAADATRQPNDSVPNPSSPSAIIHFPSGGCTHEPVSFSFSRQYRSSALLMSHRSFE